MANNIPAGTYTIVYQICDKLNSGNCAITTVTVVVGTPTITADPDTFTITTGTSTKFVLDKLTLTAGAELERRRALPWITGLPLRGDGVFPGYPRRMSTASPWSKWAIDKQGFFAETVWKWRENWQLKAAWNWRREKGDWDFGFLSGYVDPVPGS